MPDHELGRYTGRLLLEPLPDGRRMKVVEEFGFMEADGLHWPVPPQTTVDGASIPQPLWSIIGGPFEGKYRFASVVHDYYCDVRSADWQSVHLMFYRAMLVSGVSRSKAKTMYAAVYFAGPRWSDTVVENVRLGPPAIPSRSETLVRSAPDLSDDNISFSIRHDPATLAMSQALEREGTTAFDWGASRSATADADSEVVLRLDALSAIVERDDPSLRSLELAIDRAMSFFPNAEVAPRRISVSRPSRLGEP